MRGTRGGRRLILAGALALVVTGGAAVLEVAPDLHRAAACWAGSGAACGIADVDDLHLLAEDWGLELPAGAHQVDVESSEGGFQGDGDLIVTARIDSPPAQGAFAEDALRQEPGGDQRAVIGRIREQTGSALREADVERLRCGPTLHRDPLAEGPATSDGTAESDGRASSARTLIICAEPGTARYVLFEERI